MSSWPQIFTNAMVGSNKDPMGQFQPAYVSPEYKHVVEHVKHDKWLHTTAGREAFRKSKPKRKAGLTVRKADGTTRPAQKV